MLSLKCGKLYYFHGFLGRVFTHLWASTGRRDPLHWYSHESVCAMRVRRSYTVRRSEPLFLPVAEANII